MHKLTFHIRHERFLYEIRVLNNFITHITRHDERLIDPVSILFADLDETMQEKVISRLAKAISNEEED